MDKIMVALGIAIVFWCIGDAIVRIIKANKSGGGALEQRVADLESDLAEAEQDLVDARKRIEVLETIVTDDRDDLRRKIDDLARGA